ncbi:MAG: TetR/AcrR family transcriptional regulator [Pseudonocardia sp.]|nr:TetR/AcrR family transcriptional regulator [Pseudonocardia sp.]
MAESARRAELLESAYRHTLEHGLVGMSLRPLAQAVGSSPRVLLYLFGSKDGLVRALLERARADELALLQAVRHERGTLAGAAVSLWRWLAAPEHGRLLALWIEAYARSLVEPDGPWAGFAARTVDDWLGLLGDFAADPTDRTLVLAVLRGALLDLLATGDRARITPAVERLLRLAPPRSQVRRT